MDVFCVFLPCFTIVKIDRNYFWNYDDSICTVKKHWPALQESIKYPQNNFPVQN